MFRPDCPIDRMGYGQWITCWHQKLMAWFLCTNANHGAEAWEQYLARQWMAQCDFEHELAKAAT